MPCPWQTGHSCSTATLVWRRCRVGSSGMQDAHEVGDGHLRRAALGADVEDLVVGDALEVLDGDGEGGVSELALEEVDAVVLADPVDGEAVAELVRRDPPADAELLAQPPQLVADLHGVHLPAGGGAVDDAEDGAERVLLALGEPR